MTKKSSKSKMGSRRSSTKSSGNKTALKTASKIAPKPIQKAITFLSNLSPQEKALIVKGLVFLVPLLIPSVRSKFPKMMKTFMGNIAA